MGRALCAVRRQAVHGRQYRGLHGRLVPPRDQEPRRRRRLENPLARARRRSLSPARRHPADHLARRDPGGAAIGRHRRRRIRRTRLRHRARALPLRAVLLRPRLQQAERHRRMHRLAQGLDRPRCRDAGDREARLRRRSLLRAGRDGAAQHRGAGDAHGARQCATAPVPARSHCRGANDGARRARRPRRQEFWLRKRCTVPTRRSATRSPPGRASRCKRCWRRGTGRGLCSPSS